MASVMVAESATSAVVNVRTADGASVMVADSATSAVVNVPPTADNAANGAAAKAAIPNVIGAAQGYNISWTP